jgi:hypothetical protein
MPSDKYQRYGLPVEPKDPNAEFMTIQETAFVLKCSVPTVRRRVKELGIETAGRRKMLSRKNRIDINGSEARPRRRRTPAAA